MKKVGLILGMVGIFISACATVNVTAPPGSNVQIATKGAAGPGGCMMHTQKRFIYVLWGLIPLGDNSTSTLVPQSGQVVVQTQYTFVDLLLNAIGGYFSLHFKTATVYECK